MGKSGPDRVREGLDVLACLWVVDEFKVRLWHCAKNIDDQLKLVEALGAREDGLPPKQLSKNATNRPDINGCIVVVTAEEKLRGSVPACNNILGHELALSSAGAGKAKVADLQVTVGIHKEVARLEVTMEDVR